MWQPIETAPKDGTHILGYDKARIGYAPMTVIKYRVSEWYPRGFWELVETGSYAEDGEWYPTHWMPLPDPPSDISPETP